MEVGENLAEYLFLDVDETLGMVEGAYKKLKSHFYFDKTLLFAKKRIATLESDRDLFKKTLSEIAEHLTYQNPEYFQNLIDGINFKILPKKFISTNGESDTIQGSPDHEQNIAKVNFFIDMPVELFIIDYLWTILLGKMATENPDSFKYSAATAFKKSVFNADNELRSGIDFNSNRSFEPYFQLYSQWRKGAFDTIQKEHSHMDTILVCLDLKSFYYSVEFSFSKLYDYFNNDKRLLSFNFLTQVIERIYFVYTKIISKYKKGIRNKRNTCVFPIGITSTILLRELYLKPLDQMIVDKLSPLYYSRYVDDILLVLQADEVKTLSKEDIIKKYLLTTGITTVSKKSDLKFCGYNNVRIQKEKINCFAFPKKQKTILLDIYAEAIQMNSSEANLLPDIDILNSSFTKNAYNIQNLEFSNKIRDLGFLQNNNYNATRFINSLQRLIKNTSIDPNVIDNYLDQIEEFYCGSQSVEYSNNWRAIFELFLLCGEQERARKFYVNIQQEIKQLHFVDLDNDEVLENKKQALLNRLKRNLNEKLLIAAALATSLDYKFGKSKRVRALAKCFRESNLLNHTMIAYPLLNYSSVQSVALTESNLSNLFAYSNINNIFELDKFKLKWSPRYINSIEFFIANFLYGFYDKVKMTIDPNIVFDKFVKYNNLGSYLVDPFGIEECTNIRGTINYLFRIKDHASNNPKIALVNTNIAEDDALLTLTEPKKNLTVENKLRLFKILNTAKQEKVDILVFPEFYFPSSWLMDIAIFAIKNKITIITGLQYMVSGNRAFNNVCTVNPVVMGKSFISGFIQFREKNFYAPKEKIALSQRGYICSDESIPIYYIVSNGKYRYSTILCYEFTDIVSRANMKSQIEALFVPQLNRDTNYFSAIVESSARDLHCFVVQANTSAYGDSRITAPYKTQCKNILQIKGGDTDVVMIAQLDMDSLIEKRTTYASDLKKNVDACINCKHIRNKKLSLKQKSKKCHECAFSMKNGYIKGIPPNF